MSVASTGLAVRPVGAAGGGGAPPSSTAESTAVGPATRVTVMVTEPPAATLIGTLTQAPCEKSVLMLALRTPEPSLTLMLRSEERRVGKECRCRWVPQQEKEKIGCRRACVES